MSKGGREKTNMKDQIDQHLQNAVSGPLAAISAVVCDSDGIIYEGAFGERSPGGQPMTSDTVGAIMSMTKAITGTAAMQLVEQGKLSLDAPASEICPYLGEVQVFAGYDAAGEPRLRDPVRPVTLKNLLTHSSGFVYHLWNAQAQALQEKLGCPSITTRTKKSLEVPLMFDPDERWEYGIGIDWVGQMVEAVAGETLGEYFAKHVTGPLQMLDTGFSPTQGMLEKMVAMQHRDPQGNLALPPVSDNASKMPVPEFEMGGGGLLSSARDYSRFLRMILRGGELDGVRILRSDTLDTMCQNQMGDLRVSRLPTANEGMSLDAEFFPGDAKSWGLTFQISEAAGFTGRPAGTLMWAGLSNCFFWIDRQHDVAGVFVSQVLPFVDTACLDAYYEFEKIVYDHVNL